MACQKLSSLSSAIFPDLSPHHHPRLSLFPFPPPQPDPLSFPGHSFLFPSSPAPPSASCVRRIFEEAAHPVVPQPDMVSAVSSTESSAASSCFRSRSSDDDEDDTGSSSSSSSLSSAASAHQNAATAHAEGPLDSLSSLCAALPIKRGLSRFFSGKSQSFSSLARVSSVADLAKPENPSAKRRRTAPEAEQAGSMFKHHSYPPRCAGITKARPTSSRHKSLRAAP